MQPGLFAGEEQGSSARLSHQWWEFVTSQSISLYFTQVRLLLWFKLEKLQKMSLSALCHLPLCVSGKACPKLCAALSLIDYGLIICLPLYTTPW